MESKIKYKPVGVCSRSFEITIDGQIIKGLNAEGGCNGNLKGLSSLLDGMNISEAISKLSGIRCKEKMTSCPDQIAKALERYVKEQEGNI